MSANPRIVLAHLGSLSGLVRQSQLHAPIDRLRSDVLARGRPRIAKEVCDLIRRMSLENPFWGATNIHGELLKLGIQVAQHSFDLHGAAARSAPICGQTTYRPAPPGMMEEYSAKLLLLGGRPGVTPDNFRRYIALSPDQVVPLVLLNNVTAEVIQEALAQLGTTRTWSEMTRHERWRWLRTTG